MWIDVGGAATVSVAPEAEPGITRGIERAFTPYLPHVESASGIGVLIRPVTDVPAFRDIENAAGDGLVTAYDGERAYVLRGRQACVVPDPVRECPAVFAYTARFPVLDLVRSYIRPAVALAALANDAVVVHASAVAINGRAILVGGWSESGKTEIALALAEAGAEFISDKWTIVRADGTVCPFPASVGIRRWVLPYLPKLRAKLPRLASAQIVGAAAASFASRPIRRPSGNAFLREAGALSTKLVAMADRVALSVDQVRAAYATTGDVKTPVPLGLVVLLSTVAPGTTPEVVPVDPGTVAGRLAQAAAFERRAYFSVTKRVRYGGASHDRTDGPAVTGLETNLLRVRFAATGRLEVRAPFPNDPRRVVEPIFRGLEGR
jgi:hypothetical protein